MTTQMPPRPDILICGAGIIGLTLALELHSRGAEVAIVDPLPALGQASSAAAGMLAAHDPHNPPALQLLAEYSEALYPKLLTRIETLSGIAVPFQTDTTLQYLPDGSVVTLAEHSLDPRQLGAALLAAVRATSIRVLDVAGSVEFTETSQGLRVETADGMQIHPERVVHASGAWFKGKGIVTPRKGQMLLVQMPPELSLHVVHRCERVYVVPRTLGPQAGDAVIGATVEDVGFDTSVHARDLAGLRAQASELIVELGDEGAAPQLEAWAGLRPATRDGLPVLGAEGESARQWVATGHFRNGILLAPATAQVMADLLEGKTPAVDLAAFSPQRFLSRD